MITITIIQNCFLCGKSRDYTASALGTPKNLGDQAKLFSTAPKMTPEDPYSAMLALEEVE